MLVAYLAMNHAGHGERLRGLRVALFAGAYVVYLGVTFAILWR